MGKILNIPVCIITVGSVFQENKTIIHKFIYMNVCMSKNMNMKMILIPLYKRSLLKNITKCFYEYKNFKLVLFISYIKLLLSIVFVFLSYLFVQNLNIKHFLCILCISYIKFLLSIVFIFISFFRQNLNTLSMHQLHNVSFIHQLHKVSFIHCFCFIRQNLNI